MVVYPSKSSMQEEDEGRKILILGSNLMPSFAEYYRVSCGEFSKVSFSVLLYLCVKTALVYAL